VAHGILSPSFCSLSLLVERSVFAPFARLISHQPAVLFSQNEPATSNQPAVLFSQNEPATSQQYSSLRTNQPSATSQPNRLFLGPLAAFWRHDFQPALSQMLIPKNTKHL
jgi:hypothetical protein